MVVWRARIGCVFYVCSFGVCECELAFDMRGDVPANSVGKHFLYFFGMLQPVFPLA